MPSDLQKLIRMDTKEFTQRRFFRSTHFKLERDGISVTDRSLFHSHRRHVAYECIPPRAEELTLSNRKWLSAAVILTLITLVCLGVLIGTQEKDAPVAVLFWGVLAAPCWGMFFLSRRSVLIYAQNNSLLVLTGDNPTPDAVARFVRDLFQARNAYLRSKYASFTPDQPLAERLSYLNLLRDQAVLTEEEYSRLRKQQSSPSPERSGPIGFAP